MLDSKTIQVIKSTVPVLETEGEKITTHFYELMFRDHPELYNIFNIVHQKKKEQPRALANVVYQAAAHIDQLPSLLPALERVFQKHRSLGVEPEHYPIVGKYLLMAIKDVLGDLATDEIMEAWEKAYGVLASVFVEKEAERYYDTAQQTGGWPGWRSFVVKKKVKESNVITSFYLYPADGQPLPQFRPGQYVSVKVPVAKLNIDQIRQYSLSDAPGKAYYRISVKREDGDETYPAGMVSTYLHNQIKEGDTLPLSAPAGDFFLDQTKHIPIVFISGGVGFTPLLSMINTLIEKDTKRPIVQIHAAINGEFDGMKNHIKPFAEKYSQLTSYVCYEQPTEEDLAKQNFDKKGLIDAKWLEQILPSIEADIYFCGPVPFMRVMKQCLASLGVHPENIHYEFFGSATSLEPEVFA